MPLQVAEFTLKFMFCLGMRCVCKPDPCRGEGKVCPGYLAQHDMTVSEYESKFKGLVGEYNIQHEKEKAAKPQPQWPPRHRQKYHNDQTRNWWGDQTRDRPSKRHHPQHWRWQNWTGEQPLAR